MAVLVDSSAAFLTAYFAQLWALHLAVCRPSSARRLLESVLQCSQLNDLSISSSEDREPAAVPQHHVDVEQLDEAVPPCLPCCC